MNSKEVITCKECRYYVDTKEEANRYWAVDELKAAFNAGYDGLCRSDGWYDEAGGMQRVYSDDYCSYGERKEE